MTNNRSNPSNSWLAKGEAGSMIIAALVACAIFGIGVAIIAGTIGNIVTSSHRAQLKGDVEDIRTALSREITCSGTVTANPAACKTGGFVTLATSSCAAINPPDKTMLKPAFPTPMTGSGSRSYDIRARCSTVGLDTYALNIEYASIDKVAPTKRDWKPLMNTDQMTCVVPSPPPDFIWSSGWEARGALIQMTKDSKTTLHTMGDDHIYGNSGAYVVQRATIDQTCAFGFSYYHLYKTTNECNGPAVMVGKLPKGDNYSSCGDNTSGLWDKTMDKGKGNFKIVSACANNGNLWMGGAVQCHCQAQPPVVCKTLH